MHNPFLTSVAAPTPAPPPDPAQVAGISLDLAHYGKLWRGINPLLQYANQGGQLSFDQLLKISLLEEVLTRSRERAERTERSRLRGPRGLLGPMEGATGPDPTVPPDDPRWRVGRFAMALPY